MSSTPEPKLEHLQKYKLVIQLNVSAVKPAYPPHPHDSTPQFITTQLQPRLSRISVDSDELLLERSRFYITPQYQNMLGVTSVDEHNPPALTLGCFGEGNVGAYEK